MFDAKELKDNLTIDHYRTILNELGVQPNESNSEYWTMPTICHNLDWSNASNKLYFYLDTQTFFCYTECSTSFDIIGLIQKRWDMEELDYKFCDILKWIANVAELSTEDICLKVKQTCGWKSSLNKYIKRQPNTYEGKIYDKGVLGLCLPFYHTSFLNDNISKETLEKFKVGWYPQRAQISLPVFSDNGELLGIHCRNTIQSIVDSGKKYIPLRTASGQYNFKTSEVLYGINVNKPWIEQTQQVLLFEAPKSVLQMDTIYGHSNALAIFGMNVSTKQRDMLVNYGVNEVVLCLDRQYQDINGAEWEKYQKNIYKIAKLFKGYAKVTSVTDVGHLLKYKDSPSDKGYEIFDKLFRERYEVVV